MTSYHFNCGNSTDGHIGFCASIRAKSPEEAVKILKAALPHEQELNLCDGDRESGVEYITVYFNDAAITKEHIDDVDPDKKEE